MLCPQAVRVPGASSGRADLAAHPPSSGRFWACQACKYQKVLSISQMRGMAGERPHAQLGSAGLWSDALGQKWEKLLPSYTGSEVPEPLQSGRFSFRGSEDAQVEGSGSRHDLATIRHRPTLK